MSIVETYHAEGKRKTRKKNPNATKAHSAAAVVVFPKPILHPKFRIALNARSEQGPLGRVLGPGGRAL